MRRAIFNIGYAVGCGHIVFSLWHSANWGQMEPAASGPDVDYAIKRETNWVAWGGLLLGFLTLGSTHYFKLREARRADRKEAREIHDKRISRDDIR